MCEYSHIGSSTNNVALNRPDYGVFVPPVPPPLGALPLDAPGVLISTFVVLFKPPPKTNQPTTSSSTITTTAHTAPEPPLRSTTVVDPGGFTFTSAISLSRKWISRATQWARSRTQVPGSCQQSGTPRKA